MFSVDKFLWMHVDGSFPPTQDDSFARFHFAGVKTPSHIPRTHYRNIQPSPNGTYALIPCTPPGLGRPHSRKGTLVLDRSPPSRQFYLILPIPFSRCWIFLELKCDCRAKSSLFSNPFYNLPYRNKISGLNMLSVLSLSTVAALFHRDPFPFPTSTLFFPFPPLVSSLQDFSSSR